MITSIKSSPSACSTLGYMGALDVVLSVALIVGGIALLILSTLHFPALRMPGWSCFGTGACLAVVGRGFVLFSSKRDFLSDRESHPSASSISLKNKPYEILPSLKDKIQLEDGLSIKQKLGVFLKAQNIVGLTIEQEKDLASIVDVFLNKEEYAKRNILPSRGLILHGPPGTGKSMIAKAVANLIAMNIRLAKNIRAPQFGLSETNVRELFSDLPQGEITVLIIDEAETLLPNRKTVSSSNNSLGTVEHSIVSVFLTNLDGLEKKNEEIFLILTTNDISHLEPALMRGGRFKDQIEIGLLDSNQKKVVFEFYLKKLRDKDLLELSDQEIDAILGEPLLSAGDDFKWLVNESEILAVEEREQSSSEIQEENRFLRKVTIQEFNTALEKMKKQKAARSKVGDKIPMNSPPTAMYT